MPQPKHPTPLPRKQFNLTAPTEDATPLKCRSVPQSPTKSGQENLGCSSPPPVAPKKSIGRKTSAGNEEFMEKVKMLDQCFKEKSKPPPLPPKPPKMQLDDENEALEAKILSDQFEAMTPWKTMCNDLTLRGTSYPVIIEVKAAHLYKAFQHYISLMSERQGPLKERIDELGCIADNLDKVSKGTKIAGITGGATTVAGGVAAAAGVILSPFTLGASLALTAVGVGVAAAGGVTGASAAIANKVNCTQDRKKIEKILNDYESLNKDIQACLIFINEGMEHLTQHDLSIFINTKVKLAEAATVQQLFAQGRAYNKALEANSKTSGMIEGFALGMDLYFTQGKDGPKVKKGFESKLAKKLRTLADDLQGGLDELIKMKDLFIEHC